LKSTLTEVVKYRENSADLAAIESAYEDRIRTLYNGLATNLRDGAKAQINEKEAVERFRAGLNTARRARELALAAAALASST
jgi:hypothetical protein